MRFLPSEVVIIEKLFLSLRINNNQCKTVYVLFKQFLFLRQRWLDEEAERRVTYYYYLVTIILTFVVLFFIKLIIIQVKWLLSLLNQIHEVERLRRLENMRRDQRR